MCVCVFGGGAGHLTTDDWSVCEHDVSESVMIGLGRVHFYRLPQSHIERELRQRKFRMLGRHVIHVDFR